jgi:hypothetical protein
MADLERAVTEILGCFRPGRGSFLTDLFSRRIDRILIAATKADHLHHESHDRLQAIVRRLADRAVARANFSGAEVDVLAMAAVRATREGTVKQGRETLPVIIGTRSTATIGKEKVRRRERNRDISRGLAEEAGSVFNRKILHMKRAWTAGPLRAVPLPKIERTAEGVTLSLPHIRPTALQFLIETTRSEPRRPAAFRIEPQNRAEACSPRTEAPRRGGRKPRAVSKSDVAIVTPAEIDVFDGGDIETAAAAGRRPAPAFAVGLSFRRARHPTLAWVMDRRG